MTHSNCGSCNPLCHRVPAKPLRSRSGSLIVVGATFLVCVTFVRCHIPRADFLLSNYLYARYLLALCATTGVASPRMAYRIPDTLHLC
jgi:hypothetical protein